MLRRRCHDSSIATFALLIPACFNPDNNAQADDTTAAADSGATTATTLDGTGSGAATGTAADETATTAAGCTAEGALDPACDGATPYCVGGSCVGCDALPADGCAALDADAPACDVETGSCVQCTATELQACAPQQVCIDDACAPCTANDQCASGVCQVDSGECLLVGVILDGTAVLAETLDATPVADVTVDVTNVAPVVSVGPTGADGTFALPEIAPGTLLDVELGLPQDTPVFVPPQPHTRVQVRLPNDTPVQTQVPVVTYAHLAQVAYECGVLASPDDAVVSGAVNVYFTQRSTVFGRLVDDQGNGVATISRTALQIDLNGFINIHESLLDSGPNPAFVCFLDRDEGTGRWVGTSSTTSNATGAFVMFRVRDPDGTGFGSATVRASGFFDGAVNLRSTGNIGVVELVRNDEPIEREFGADVNPIFTKYACIGCHGGVSPSAGMDFTLSPLQNWQTLVAPGTVCGGTPLRVCTDAPETSKMVTYPLSDLTGGPDTHPVDIFPSIDDPALQVVLQWIEQGAKPPLEYNFPEHIYPLFTKYACVGCHTAGGPADAVTNGFPSDYDLPPQMVWNDLVGPGTDCPDLAAPVRICTNAPASSLLVTYPTADAPGQADPHPVTAFASMEDPDAQIMLQWIGQGAPYEVTCAHDPCAEGVALNPSCSLCAGSICDLDPYCCNTAWDAQCVSEAMAEPLCGC